MATQVNFNILNLLPALARTASANGSGVDLRGYVNPGGRQMFQSTPPGGRRPQYMGEAILQAPYIVLSNMEELFSG